MMKKIDGSKKGFKNESMRGRERGESEIGGGGVTPHPMLISSFSFLLPCGIRMILFKVSAWATGLRNLDFIGIIITEKIQTHTDTETHTHTHIQIFFFSVTH